MIIYRVRHYKSLIEFNNIEEATSYAVLHNLDQPEQVEKINTESYDPYFAAEESIKKGREISEFMLLELNAKAKAYKQATGISLGSGLISLNANLENFLNKGALEPDAINEIQKIVATGQVDNLLDVYASALIQIDDFLGV